ncbi:MAG: hypothetical protein H6868_09860 [Rhodospirillales bacterium]|nr:hypothetical protein [Rhodospirillales bacterium]
MNTIKIACLSIVFSLILAIGIMPGTARAQICEATYEMIVSLLLPRFGFPTVWDATYGDRDHMVQLTTGLPLENGTILAAGRKLDKESYQPTEIVLTELNRRGRSLREQAVPAKPGENPVKMIPLEKGYILVSSIKSGARNERGQVRVSWYDKDLKPTKDKLLSDSNFDYEALGVVAATEGNGFIVIVRASKHTDPEDRNGLLIRLTPMGGVVWKRAYRPGIPNAIHSLSPVDDASYIAAGEIQMEDGRMGGWVLKLGYDGTILWQRTYPRGAGAVLNDGAYFERPDNETNGFVMLGDSTPLDDGHNAAWIMAIDPLGEVLWQRYYRHADFAFSGKALMVTPEGRFNLLLNASTEENDPELRDHIRMVSLSPRGVLLEDEAYIEGRQAKAMDFVPGPNGERVVTATIESDAKPPPIEEILEEDKTGQPAEQTDEAEVKPPPPVQEGWVFIGTALDPYNDPCVK